MDTEDFDRCADLEQFFLEKTVNTLDTRNQENALEVAAQFDRFKKDADDEFYAEFFTMLSALIKRKYLDRDEDFAATDLEEYLF